MNLFYVSFVVLYFLKRCSSENTELKVNYLEPGEVYYFVPEARRHGFYESDIRIYCYKGSPKVISNYFQSLNFHLDIENIDDFVQYDGETPEIVKTHYDEQKSFFSFNFFSLKKTRIKLNPFNQTCIGIETLQSYNIRLNLIRLDISKLISFVAGIFIFLFATTLTKNAIFYYLSGVTLGVCASFLILLYLAGKLFPRRSMMIGVLAGGSTIAIYVIQLIWDNIQMILVTYRTYVIWYVVITGFISFIICYRFGPPKNKRSKDLIKWSLQIAALGLIYLSSHFEEASFVIMVSIAIFHYFPRIWLQKLVQTYRRWFPPKKRLLTLEEYEQQGMVETKKALDELRDYCSSPECKQWKVMTKLKNPKRFASFIEGSEEHLMDEEVFDHENSKIDYTDSDLSEEEENYDERDKENKNIEEDDISEDEELVVPTKLIYRGGSSSVPRQNGSGNRYRDRQLNSSYAFQNNSNNRSFTRDSPYDVRRNTPNNQRSFTRDSPFDVRRTIPNNSRSFARDSPFDVRNTTPNNSRVLYRSYHREYSDDDLIQ